MNYNRHMRAFALLVLAAMAVPVFLYGGRKVDARKDSKTSNKSRYYLRQGYLRFDSTDDAYELYRHAYGLDTTNLEAAFNYGVNHTLVNLLQYDSLETENAFSMMRRYVDKFPGDLHESSLYAMVATDILERPEESIRVLNRLADIYPERTEILNTLASAYMQCDSIQKALSIVRRYEKAEGPSDKTATTKAALLMGIGDTMAAIEAVDSLINFNPQDFNAWLLQGSLYEYINQPDSAMAMYRQAEKLAPYRFNPKMNISTLYLQMGDTVQADRMMTEALATNDLSVEEKAEGLSKFISELLQKGSEGKRAFPMIEALLNQEPGNLNVLTIKVALLEHLKMYGELETTLRSMIVENPDNPTLWGRIILANINSGNLKRVPQLYDEASAVLKGPQPLIDIYLATAYTMDKQPQKAKETMLKAVKNFIPGYSDTISPEAIYDTVVRNNYNPKNTANLLQMLGDTYVSVGDTAASFRVYDQVLVLDPVNAVALNNYAYFLSLERRDLDKALQMSATVLNQYPDNGTYLDTYAYILFLQKDYEKARMYQEMAIENSADDPSAALYDHYGDILWHLGKQKLALENWKKALELEPENILIKKKVTEGKYYEK